VVPSFAKLLSLEADRWTPYNLTDIAVAWRQVASHGETKADIELRFLPLACLERCSRQLAAFDLVPSLIVLGPTQELHAQVTTDSGPRTRLRSLRNISAAILALATIVFVVTDWIVCMREGDAWRHRLQFEQNEYARQRDLEKRIAVVLSASNEQSTGEGPRSRNALLASLTAVIPTTDWLSEIVIRNDAITLRGLSAKPELLVKALEPVASNHEVTLQGELAFDAKLDRQRMSVAFRMGDKRE